MGEQPRTIGIRLGGVPASYDIVIGPGVLAGLGTLLAERTAGRRAMLVIDDGLPAGVVEVARESLVGAGFTCFRCDLRASEAEKNMDAVTRLIHELAQARLERTDTLIALGGGIVGDVAGFAAASYRRGIGFVQCPTTLLAMVDASVGGKTGVNLMLPDGMRKNLAGAFHQPLLVLADVSVLGSLPDRVFRAGLGECLKHGMIADELDHSLLDWTLQHLSLIRRNDAGTLTELVARNVSVKRWFVEADERELATDPKRSRMLLNLGHTYAHALESVGTLSPDGVPEHAPLMHGEAVLLGLVAAAHAAVEAGLFKADAAQRVRAAVEYLGVDTRLAGLPPAETLIGRMGDDKKAAGGRLRVVLPDGLGSARVVAAPPNGVLLAGWKAIQRG